MTTFQRARSPEQKGRRAEDLIDAARELATGQGVRVVTLTSIAERAGVHVSGVRRYFASREDILLVLAGEGWVDWAAEVVSALSGRSGVGPAELGDLLASSLSGRPLFCDLLAFVPLSLEMTAEVETVRAFKRRALGALDDLVAAVAAATPLDESQARELLAVTANVTGPLWHISHPAPAIAALYRDDPSLAHAAVDFAPRVARTVETTFKGLRCP